ncbi:hypothetical protein NFJ02_14g19410 [Pycnococcus provasolii]
MGHYDVWKAYENAIKSTEVPEDVRVEVEKSDDSHGVEVEEAFSNEELIVRHDVCDTDRYVFVVKHLDSLAVAARPPTTTKYRVLASEDLAFIGSSWTFAPSRSKTAKEWEKRNGPTKLFAEVDTHGIFVGVRNETQGCVEGARDVGELIFRV